jgi:dTDP-4-dehydrorhamnose 3,5-epimerase-like enzyme
LFLLFEQTKKTRVKIFSVLVLVSDKSILLLQVAIITLSKNQNEMFLVLAYVAKGT